MSVREYNAQSNNIERLIPQILKEGPRAILFTFDISRKSSFEKYLKTALRTFIFECEKKYHDNALCKRYLPFMILGLKKDMKEEAAVSKEEVSDLVRVMKSYMHCEMLNADNFK